MSLLSFRAAERGIFLVVKDAAEEQSCIPRARTVFACFMPSKRSSLLAKKPANLLLKEVGSGHGLRPVLGPLQLTSLGVGAIIGAGIFVATGKAAHNVAGPATMISYVVAGITCVFAALCYAEFSSMVPVAGSAYTYAYASFGELVGCPVPPGSRPRCGRPSGGPAATRS